MIEVTVKIGRQRIDTIQITNTQEPLFGGMVYLVKSERNKAFHILHQPRQGLNRLIQHAFSHYSMTDRWGATPTTEEEI